MAADFLFISMMAKDLCPFVQFVTKTCLAAPKDSDGEVAFVNSYKKGK